MPSDDQPISEADQDRRALYEAMAATGGYLATKGHKRAVGSVADIYLPAARQIVASSSSQALSREASARLATDIATALATTQLEQAARAANRHADRSIDFF
jgi:hypothetical protein